MKQRLSLLTMLMLAVGLLFALPQSASAQSLGTAGPAGPQKTMVPVSAPAGSVIVDQLPDHTIVPLTGISCAAGGVNAGTQYLRRFQLTPDHGIVTPFLVTDAQFGTEVNDPAGAANIPFALNVYSISIGDPFTYANMVLLDSGGGTLVAGDAGTIFLVTGFNALVDPTTDDVVMELVIGDLAATGGQYFPGANASPELQPSYIASAACGIFDPVALDDIGFPDNNNVMWLEGETDDPPPCDLRIALGADEVAAGEKLAFDVALKHNRPQSVERSFYIEVKDSKGRTMMRRETKQMTINYLDEINISRALRIPSRLKPGRYELEIGMEGMNQGRALSSKRFTVVAAKGGVTEGVPSEFTLGESYPNPFNPSTVISYGLPEASQVTLRVYNVLGKEVASLASGYQQAGTHEVTFDATNLSAGVYLYVLEAGDFSATKRMVLLK